MAKNSLGRIGFVFKGDYNNNTIYAPMDVVYYEGSSYICIKETINNLPNNTEYWHIFSKQADTKNIEKKLEFLESEFDINTVSGTSIHITDSAAAPMKIIPRGNDIVQDTREGYNLNAMADNSGGTISGTTWSIKNSEIILNGSKTGGDQIPSLGNRMKLGTFQPGTYSLILYPLSGSITGLTAGLFITDANTGGTSIASILTNQFNIVTITITETKTLYGYIYQNAGTIWTNCHLGIMIAKGELTEKPKWEQYGASPSINYPSELKYAGGSYEIWNSNKNLLKITDMTFVGQGVTSIIKNGLISCSGITTQKYFDIGNSTNKAFKTNILANTNYVFSATKAFEYNLNIRFYAKNGDRIKDFVMLKNEASILINIPKNSDHCYMWFSNFEVGTSISIEQFSIQIEKDTTAKDYIKHEGEILPLDLTEHHLYSDKDYIYKKDNKWYVHNEFENGKNLTWRKGGTQQFDDTTIFYDTVKNVKASTTNIWCSHLTQENVYSTNIVGIEVMTGNEIAIRLPNEIATTVEQLTEWLKNVEIIYELATPTETEITNSLLISQLEALLNSQSYKGVTNINSEAPTISVAELNLDVSYYISNAIRINNLEKAILSLGGNI